jgi:hypothetical protein
MTDITTPPQAPATGSGTDGPGAKEQATNVASSAKESAASVAASAADQAKVVASEAGAEAKDILADARQQLRTQANEQSDKLAALIGDIGTQLRTMAAAGDTGMAKDLVDGVAEQAQGISSRLSEGGLDRTLEDARRLARNRPGLFLAGAALVGFVAARVARNVDTESIKQAVDPHKASNGANGHTPSAVGPAGERTLESPAATPRLEAGPLTAPTQIAQPMSPTEGSR